MRAVSFPPVLGARLGAWPAVARHRGARFEPMVDVAAGAVCAVRADARGTDPGDVDLQVLDTAIEQLARWRSDPATSTLTLVLAVPARSVRREQCWVALERGLTDWNIAGEALAVELADPAGRVAARTVRLWREGLAPIGPRVGLAANPKGVTGAADVGSALDSSGADFVSLGRSVLARLGSGADAAAALTGVVAAAHARGAAVVVGGVQDPASLEVARDAGCDTAYGRLFAPPLTSAEIEMLIASRRRW